MSKSRSREGEANGAMMARENLVGGVVGAKILCKARYTLSSMLTGKGLVSEEMQSSQICSAVVQRDCSIAWEMGWDLDSAARRARVQRSFQFSTRLRKMMFSPEKSFSAANCSRRSMSSRRARSRAASEYAQADERWGWKATFWARRRSERIP